MLILIAVILLSDSAKSLTDALDNDAGPYFIAIDEHATRTTKSGGSKLGYESDLKWSITRNATFSFMGGTLLFLGGILLLLKRFSLKSAIVTVLLAGGTGMLPMLLPKGPPTKLLVSITIDKGLSDSQVATLGKALSPEVVIALLPQSLKDAFAAVPNAGVTRVHVKKNDSGDESTLTLEAEFATALGENQRNEIAGFLYDSFHELTVRAAKAEGFQPDFGGIGPVIVSEDWYALHNAWLVSAGPELDSVFSNERTDVKK